MCKFEDLGVSWPPKGWRQLNNIDQTFGQAIHKNPQTALVTGLSYVVEPIPSKNCKGQRKYIYKVDIRGWDYNIYNESCEYHVLSFTFKDRHNLKDPKHYYMADIRTRGQSLALNERSAHRTYMAAMFMMKQISAGQVSDVERILRLYKIHPTQSHLYEVNAERHDSLFCGLMEADNTASKKETAL